MTSRSEYDVLRSNHFVVAHSAQAGAPGPDDQDVVLVGRDGRHALAMPARR